MSHAEHMIGASVHIVVSMEDAAKAFICAYADEQASFFELVAQGFQGFNGCLQRCYIAEELVKAEHTKTPGEEWVEEMMGHITLRREEDFNS